MQPIFKYKGLNVYSIQGLAEYLAYYYDKARSPSMLDNEERELLQSKIRELKFNLERKQDEDSNYKKKYFKLKSRAQTKYDIYTNPNTGVKVLIPRELIGTINNGQKQGSPKTHLENLARHLEDVKRTTLLAEYFKEKLSSKDPYKYVIQKLFP